jgi:hypothetical protein
VLIFMRSNQVDIPANDGCGRPAGLNYSGFLQFGVAALNIYFGNLYSGLWYPVVCSAVAAVIGFVAMLEAHKTLQ